MKRVFSLFVILASVVLTVCLIFTSCTEVVPDNSGETEDEQNGIAVFRNDFWEMKNGEDLALGTKDWALEKGIRYISVKPDSFETDDVENKISEIISEKYSTLIFTGIQYSEAVGEAAQYYPDVDFFIFEAYPSENTLKNVSSVFFDQYDSGYLAGRLCVMSGKRNIGYFAALETDDLIRTETGFIAGISDSASENPEESYSLDVLYGERLMFEENYHGYDDLIYPDGREIVLASGGNAAASVSEIAEKKGSCFCCFDKAFDSSESFEFAVVPDYSKAPSVLLEKYFGSEYRPEEITLGLSEKCFNIEYKDGTFGENDIKSLLEEAANDSGVENKSVSVSDNVTVTHNEVN